MAFDLVITKHFAKQYLNKKFISEEVIIEKAREIEMGVFYAGEGRVKGSKVLYKKRIKLHGQSKRKGGRILFVIFHHVKNIYVPYAVWMANESIKQRMDERLKNKKEFAKIIQDTIVFMESSS